MALRFRPVDTAFYDLFTESAQHLVDGRRAARRDAQRGRRPRGRRQADARGRARGRRDHPRDRPRGSTATFVTPFDREDIYALASGLDDVMDMMDEVVDLILLYEVEDPARRAVRPGRGASSAAPSSPPTAMPRLRSMTGPRGVLDRDQPARERRRQELPPDPRQAVQRRVQGDRGAQAQGHRRVARGRHRRLREGRQHRGADRRQGVLSRWSSRSSSRSSSSPWSSTTPTASTTRPTRSPPRSRPAR